MACSSEGAREALSGRIGAVYQEVSRFPSVTYASVGSEVAARCGAKCLPLYTEWRHLDLERHQKLRFSRQYILHHDSRAIISVTPVGMPAEIHNLLLTGMSPTGKYKAILTHYLEMGQKQEVLEVWSNSGRVRNINLTALDKHGKVYTDGKGSNSRLGRMLLSAGLAMVLPQSCSQQRAFSYLKFFGQRWLLTGMSPTGKYKAILTHYLEMGQKQEVLEVWSNSGRVRNINLTALDKHGKVYTDEFCKIVLNTVKEGPSLMQVEVPGNQGDTVSQGQVTIETHSYHNSSYHDKEMSRTLYNDRFVYNDNWGEALGDKSVPVLCVLNIETSEVSVLEDIPGHLSPGQALWSPGDKGIIFVGWWHEPFRLGLNACSNRRSALFLFDLSENSCELLTSDDQSVSSPRLSPDQTHLIYLEGPVFGPHRHCLKLQLLNWQTKSSYTVVDIVRTAIAGFYGIYSGALSMHCWASDNQRILLSTPQRSRKEVLVVDTKSGSVKSITSGTSEGSWTLLGVQQDLLVVSCSSPNCPPSLRVGVLPPAGSELELQWISVEESSVLPDMEWKILTVDPAMSEKGSPYTDQSFEAILLIPRGSKQGKEAPLPLMVSPHGGPHSVFDACWRPTMAGLCRLGFAVLLVNYRGSLGFGQDSIDSLISRVGVQDVADTQLAVEAALQMDIYLDPNRIALLGGSHGGFICCHLIGQFPERYKACAVRNSVTNMATLLGTSDIPDWRYASLGLPYSYERIPTEKDLSAMLLSSPIIHAAKVRAPLLLCVGAKDRRVSPYQALEYYRVLKARGIPVQLMWYPEENHALSGVVAEADVFMNCAQWIIHHLSRKVD
ncbi:acylamino-acid-releasing enzyme [Protobothrops mucrosquamatus]|uniref:acylamino-acid-releasing enzyme n=1 Tax=Protobothrops mucrosquamatus TaxID=103944 RepID=UPI0010FAED0C|nr:acylamino-acid-releasing enzyme [Protobothrops mucrosquamatus]